MEQSCKEHNFIPDSIAFPEENANAIMILSCIHCDTEIEVSRKDLSPIDQEIFDDLAQKWLQINMKDRMK